MKLTFKKYYEEKKALLSEAQKTVYFSTVHDVSKYCKIPLNLEEQKNYVSLKPNDRLLIEWKRTAEEMVAISITFNGKTYHPCWNSSKTKNWVETTTSQIFEAS